MSRSGMTLRLPRVRFPRVSGDEPPPVRWLEDKGKFSPRERG